MKVCSDCVKLFLPINTTCCCCCGNSANEKRQTLKSVIKKPWNQLTLLKCQFICKRLSRRHSTTIYVRFAGLTWVLFWISNEPYAILGFIANFKSDTFSNRQIGWSIIVKLLVELLTNDNDLVFPIFISVCLLRWYVVSVRPSAGLSSSGSGILEAGWLPWSLLSRLCIWVQSCCRRNSHLISHKAFGGIRHCQPASQLNSEQPTTFANHQPDGANHTRLFPYYNRWGLFWTRSCVEFSNKENSCNLFVTTKYLLLLLLPFAVASVVVIILCYLYRIGNKHTSAVKPTFGACPYAKRINI